MVKQYFPRRQNGNLSACCICGNETDEFISVKFSTHEKTEAAIEAFRDDLMWYFLEFAPRLDMRNRKTEQEQTREDTPVRFYAAR